MIRDNQIAEARKKIRVSNRIVIASHIRPDGDAIGSLLGIGLALEATGKHVQMVLADGVPENFGFLSGSEKILTNWQMPVDCIIIVDSSEFSRVGPIFLEHQTPDLNIDHHVTNRDFARINLVDSNAAATAEILFHILPQLDLPLTNEVNNALLTGILTDTIGFRTRSVSPETLRSAATLMENGADLARLYQNALGSRSLAALRYWGNGLNKLEFENGLVWTTLTMDARNKTGYPGRDDADLVNILSAMQDVNIAIVFVEQSDGSIKVSWRAQNGYDVSGLAEEFGGGGHKAASGAELIGPVNEITKKVLEKTRLVLNKTVKIQGDNDE